MATAGRPRRVLAVIGTRPEAIKMAPVVTALRRADLAVSVCATGQHRELLDQVVRLFEVQVDRDLGPMVEDQEPAELLSRLLPGLTRCLRELRPDAVVAQGDTTTTLAAALASFYERRPFFHVEAGLRTHDPERPYPEETHRQLVARLASLHFAPTRAAVDALRREGIPAERIHQTGNTVVDALRSIAQRVGHRSRDAAGDRRVVLVTLHRRENQGQPLRRVCAALLRLAERRPALRFVLPVHPNPNVSLPLRSLLAECESVALVEPLAYREFVQQMIASDLILTDSGGIQEEAPVLGKPVLVLREQTERPEAVAAGVALLVGTDPGRICREVERLLDDPGHYARMARGGSLFGDGRAAERIAEAVRSHLTGSG